ncbi:MAG: choice-of-anchor J domain-containing protein [Candidatus Cloacimonetes bacterium]|nr:choice-of-anchor J domain-containing protein [Candidatus Cloacimonadota bacterium]
MLKQKKVILFSLMLFSIVLMFAQASDLFFSEYIEGSSNNKAIEIFNGTGGSVDISDYTVKRANNGGDWGFEEQLSGDLANGDVFVIANDSAVPEILDIADITSQLTWYNGDDVLALYHNDTLIDIIGVYQEDPGTAWPVAGVADGTKEHTLVRKSTVTEGSLDWIASAGTDADNSEWIVYDQDTFEFLGAHQMGDVETPSIVGSFNDWNPADPDFALVQNEFGVWEHIHTLAAGSWEYKAIEGDTWDAENYPENNQIIDLTEETEVTWKANFDANLVTHTNPVIAGNFISELGGTDWEPTDMTGEMIDYDEEEVFEWNDLVPAGTWEFKVTLNQNWDQNTGANVTFISDGLESTYITYNMSNNITTASGPEPDAAEITFTIDDSYGQTHSTFFIKGSWNPTTGTYDPNWGDGAETELFDDGTNGDETAGDHIFSVMIELIVDGGSNTWEWGALDANSNWIDGNWQFQIVDMTPQTLSYTMEVPELSIAEIQGETENSPYDGYIVETWGIVTAVDNNGFFLQDDEMMWSGIFVYFFESTFSIGDEIYIIAKVEEYNGLTELKDTIESGVLSSGNPLFTALEISTLEANEEAYEGVLVKVQNAECTNADLGYGEWEVDDDSGICRIDDMFYEYFPEEGEFYSITGVLNYSYGDFKIEPRDENDVISGSEEFGGLECFVEDENGEILEDVLVNVNGEAYYTNNAGTIEVQLPVGVYTVTFSLEGYQIYVVDDVEIIVDETTYLDVVLIEANPDLLPPTNLTVEMIGETEAIFSWDPPAGDGDEIEEGFDADNLPEDWNIIDNDSDGYNWEVSADWGGNNDSAHCMTSASYRNDVGALFPDNWLISPALTIGGTSELHFWVAAQDPAWAAEQYYVKVSTSGDQISDFTTTIHSEVLSIDTYTEVVLSLSDFAGQTIYLAWQHADVTDMFWMNLDDISIMNTATREVSFSADFETVKSVRQFKSGNSFRNENYRDRELTGYNVYLDGNLVADNISETEYLFIDLGIGETYAAGVAAVYTNGTSEIVEIEIYITDTIDNGINGIVTKLGSNYPNPFNPETKINFSTKESGNVIIEIFNPKGQKVKILTNKSFDKGNHSIIWNGLDEHNNRVSSGVYLYKMKTKEYNSTQKMILMK